MNRHVIKDTWPSKKIRQIQIRLQRNMELDQNLNKDEID